jgi:hypothetical protein
MARHNCFILQFRHWTPDERQQTFPDRKLTLAVSHALTFSYLHAISDHSLPLSSMSGVYGLMSELQCFIIVSV